MQPFDQNYQPQFSGHETFPLRYGWLKKAFDAVVESEKTLNNKNIFKDEFATARFGVGKNMVASMRHWGNSTGTIYEPTKSSAIQTSPVGHFFFGKQGLDPYMEHASTLWFLHWQLASNPKKTTWYWSFNHFAGTTFERNTIVRGLSNLAIERKWTRASTNTIKRDVECFIRTYVARNFNNQSSYEDVFESPFTELGLIQRIGRRDGFQFIRGPKVTLGDGVLLYAIMEFWSGFQDGNTLSLDSLLYAPGSPGRVFLLNEDGLIERLVDIEEISDGVLRWSETAGIRQLLRDEDSFSKETLKVVEQDY